MAAFAGLAHGGIAGAVIEALVALAVVAILVAVWLRERRGDGDSDTEEAASLTDDEWTPS